MNLDSIKQQLSSQGVKVWPDMHAPVEIMDGQARAAEHKSIPVDWTEQQVVECLITQGNQIAFRDIISMDFRDPHSGSIKTKHSIRYAVWR